MLPGPSQTIEADTDYTVEVTATLTWTFPSNYTPSDATAAVTDRVTTGTNLPDPDTVTARERPTDPLTTADADPLFTADIPIGAPLIVNDHHLYLHETEPAALLLRSPQDDQYVLHTTPTTPSHPLRLTCPGESAIESEYVTYLEYPTDATTPPSDSE